MEEGEGLNKGTRGVVEVGGGERAGGMSHLNWKSDLVGGGGRDRTKKGQEREKDIELTGPHTEAQDPALHPTLFLPVATQHQISLFKATYRNESLLPRPATDKVLRFQQSEITALL